MASVYLELPLRSVGSISAPGVASEATLAALLAELELKANLTDTQPVSGSFTITGSATEAKQDTQITRLNLLSTEAKQDTQTTHLSTIAGKDFATQTTLAALLVELALKADLSETQPVSIASMPTTPVTGTFWQATQPVSVADPVTTKPKAVTGTYAENLALTTVQTFTAPANAIGAIVQADDANAANFRAKQGAIATSSSGIQFQPGRSEEFKAGSDISICSEGASVKVYVQWFVQV